MWRKAISSRPPPLVFSSGRIFLQQHVSLQRDRALVGVRLKTLAVFHRFGRFAVVVADDLHLKRVLGTKQTAQNEKEHRTSKFPENV